MVDYQEVKNKLIKSINPNEIFHFFFTYAFAFGLIIEAADLHGWQRTEAILVSLIAINTYSVRFDLKGIKKKLDKISK